MLSRPAPIPAPRRRMLAAAQLALLAVLALVFSIPALLGPWISPTAPPPAIAILRPATTAPAGYLPTPAGPAATTPDGRVTTQPAPATPRTGGGC